MTASRDPRRRDQAGSGAAGSDFTSPGVSSCSMVATSDTPPGQAVAPHAPSICPAPSRSFSRTEGRVATSELTLEQHASGFALKAVPRDPQIVEDQLADRRGGACRLRRPDALMIPRPLDGRAYPVAVAGCWSAAHRASTTWARAVSAEPPGAGDAPAFVASVVQIVESRRRLCRSAWDRQSLTT